MTEPSETWTIQQHQAWQDTLRDLRNERDMCARVVAGFVLDGEWDLATSAAKEYDAARTAVRAHLDVLTPPTDRISPQR